MEQSYLIELIQTLSNEEKVHVKEFAALSFFNNGRMRAKVVPLLDLCMSHSWDDATAGIDKKSMYAIIFPEQEFKEGRLEKTMVEAHKIVRAFLQVKHYFREANEFHQILDYSTIARTRGLESRYQHMIARLQKIQGESTQKNYEYYYRQFHLEFSIHYQESLNNPKKGDINISNLLKATDIFSYIRRFALLSRYLLQQRMTKLDPPEFIQFYLEDTSIPETYLNESPVLKINFEIFNMLRKRLPEMGDIQSLLNLVKVNEKGIDAESLQEFYTYLRNFTVMILAENPEKEEISLMLHSLYVDNLARGYLHYEGKISASRYGAVTHNAIRMNQLEWVNEFIERYKNEIHGENESQDIYRFNKARYLFATGKFEECLDCLPPTSPFVDYLLLGKRLELKALYELKSELLSYKLDAFKMFLSRTSQKLLSDSLIQTNHDFANFLQQLVNSITGDLKRAERVHKRIEEKKQALEREWLLEKAKALKPKQSSDATDKPF